MNMFISDILLNAPFAIVVLTTLAVLIVESTKGTRPNLSSWTSIGGLALAACAALSNLGASAETFGGMLQSGGIANFYDTLFCIAAVMTIIFSRNYFERQNYHRGEAYILILFASLGMMVIAAANDLIMIFLGIELMSICLYVLAGLFRHRDRSNEASLKYFLLGAFATGFLLYGIALIYGSAGSTNITSIRAVFPRVSHDLLFLTGSGLLLAGFAFKIAAVPFHMWAPDVYEGSPTPVSGFMSTGVKSSGVRGIDHRFFAGLRPVGKCSSSDHCAHSCCIDDCREYRRPCSIESQTAARLFQHRSCRIYACGIGGRDSRRANRRDVLSLSLCTDESRSIRTDRCAGNGERSELAAGRLCRAERAAAASCRLHVCFYVRACRSSAFCRLFRKILCVSCCGESSLSLAGSNRRTGKFDFSILLSSHYCDHVF